MRLKPFAGGLVLAAALVAGGAGAAIAQDPVDLGSSHVVDDSGVLSGKTNDIDSAITKLYNDHKIDLYVVYVPTFTNPAEAESWANQTATENNFGPRDYLLAIATQGRAYYLSADSSGPVSESQVSQIESNDVEPALKKGDWSGAAVATANGLGDAVGGGGGGSAVVWVIVAILVIVGIIVVILVLRSRSKKKAGGTGGPVDELMTMPIKDLERQAGSALVQTDDVVRTSEDELGFAVAQYGADAAAPFQAALDEAKAKLKDAFRLKQKLDDSEPDTDQQVREWNAGIVRLCAEANETLDAQAKSFDELRKLEKNIPEASAAVAKQADAAHQRIAPATTVLAGLSERYTDASLATVSDNIAQANERLTFAQTALTAAEQKAQAGDTSAAAVGVRAAEDSVAQAGLLLDAIDRVSADLSNAQGGIDAAVADLEKDVADARGFAAAGDPGGTIAAAADGAERAVTDVKGRIAGGKVNPLEIVQVLQAANQNIDGVLGAVRDRQVQEQRALASLDQTLMSAQSKVSAATDFITARRGAVGADARTRLAEAGRLVVLAQSAAQTDPASALAQAQRADQLADQAIQLAQQDVGGFAGSTGGAGGMFGGGSGGSGGGELGAVLGGILIGSVLGGGNQGDGMFGGGGGGMFGGGASPGSFGGGGTRSRRGGGRF